MNAPSPASSAKRRRTRRRRRRLLRVVIAMLVGAGLVSFGLPETLDTPPPPALAVPAEPTPLLPEPPPVEEPVDAWPYGEFHGGPHGSVDGFAMFRGNPTRTYYGRGPLPTDPQVVWQCPEQAMCSIEGDRDDGGRRWCGIGWTGQPLIHRLDDGRLEVVVGGFDGDVHFVDAATGLASRRSFPTGAMVKGTASLDPDNYPLLYTGSRDGYFRIVARDRDQPTELWRLGRHPQGVWNNDGDANPTVVDDALYLAGEDSWFRVIRLNRDVDPAGMVTIDPTILLEMPSFNDELFALITDRNVSIESSPAVTDDAVYWANSGGRVKGIDRQLALDGELKITLDVWVGDDTDASIVVDRDGMLYVAVEKERRLPHAASLGQLIKLDPTRPEQPIVWQLAIPGVDGVSGPAGVTGRWWHVGNTGDLRQLAVRPHARRRSAGC